MRFPAKKFTSIALDVETTGLDPFKGDRIFGWGYMTDRGEYGWMDKTPATLAWIRRLFRDRSITIVMQNGKFDLKMFHFEDVDIFKLLGHYDDTLVMAKCLNSTRYEYDLATLADIYLDKSAEDKAAVTDWIKSNKRAFVRANGREPTFADVPRPILIKRCLWDVEATLMLWARLKPEVMSVSPDLYATERDLVFVTVDMELTGICVDRTRASELLNEAQKGLDRLHVDLQSIVGDLSIERKGKRESVPVFNPNSSQKHLPAAFQKLGIELRYKTKPKKKRGGEKTGGGNWSFDEYAMVRYVSPPLQRIIRDSGEDGWPVDRFYREVHETVRRERLPRRELLPPLILKYRELGKMCSTYYEHLLDDSIDRRKIREREYGIIHCHFNPQKALTGRFSSDSPNLQNMPRLLGPRECFVPRPGCRLFFFDYSQIEMRMFAHFAEDKSMADAIDRDIHLYVATRIYRKPESEVTKEQRKRAKSTGFGIIYGSGAETQSETLTKKGLPTALWEAEKLISAYHREFPSVRRLTKRYKDELRNRGYVANPFGRRYYIENKFGYKALNYMCQGTAADIIKRAMVKIWRWLRKGGYRTRMIVTVHDELVLEVPRSEERLVVPKIRAMMEDRENWFVPLTVDVEVTNTRWSEKKDYVVKPPEPTPRDSRHLHRGPLSSGVQRHAVVRS